MRNREYIFIRRSRIDYDRKFIVTVSRSVPYPNIPENDEHVRVYDYMSQMVIRPHLDNFYEYGFDYMLTYFDDPRASFPSPAYNWMASRGVPDFVEKLHQAALRLSLGKDFPVPQTKAPRNTTETNVTDPKVTVNSNLYYLVSMPITEDNPQPQQQQQLVNTSTSNGSTSSVIERNRKNNKNQESSTFSLKSLNIWN